MVKEIRRSTEAITKIAEQTDDLHKLHDQRDEDGVPLVYVRKSLERALDRMTGAVDRQTEMLTQFISKFG